MAAIMDFRKFWAICEAHSLLAEVDQYLEDIDDDETEDDEDDYESESTPTEPELPVTKKDTFLDSKTGSKWRALDAWRQLNAVYKHEINKGTSPNRIWVSFSDVTKLGQRMEVRSGKSTPVGVFCFPASFVIDRKINNKSGGSVPFSNRPYIHVFKAKSDHFEVGKSGDDESDATFDKLKEKFSNESGDPVTKMLNQVRKRYEKVIYTYHTNKEHPDKNVNKDDVYNYLNDLLRRYLAKALENYENVEEDDKKEAAKKVDLNFFNDSLHDDQVIEDAKKQICKTIKSANYYDYNDGKYHNRYKNIDPNDLSVELEIRFIKFILKNDDFSGDKDWEELAKQSIQGIKAKKPRRISLQELEKIDTGHFGQWSNISNYIRKVKSVALKNDPVVLIFKKMLSNTLRKEFTKFANTQEENVDSQVPYYEKIKQITDKYQLDTAKAIRKGMAEAGDKNQFLYRALKQLAIQYSEKNPKVHWQTAWNKFFREVGYSSTADTKHSGHIHGAEPTQGVMMNPADIEPIALIYNISHSDQLDPTSRPTDASWSKHDMQHARTGLKINNQRQGPQVARNYFAGLNTAGKTSKAIEQRVEDLTQYIPGKIDRNNVDSTYARLGMLLKLIRSRNPLTQPNSGEQDSTNKRIMSLIDRLDKSGFVPPSIKQQIEEIRKACARQPSNQRLGKWASTEQERETWWPRQRCPSCTRINDDTDDVRCPYCHKFYPGKKPETKDCQQCGWENDNLEDKFCPNCNRYPRYKKVYYDPNDKPPEQVCPYCEHVNDRMDDVRCPSCRKFYPNKKPQTIDCPCGFENDNLEATRCPKCKKFYEGKKPENLKVCKNCGYENEDIEDKECPHCGDYYDEKDKPPTQTCGKCGNEYDEDDEECPNCDAPSGYDPDDYQTCDHCDHEFSIDDTQCPHCGYDPTVQTCDQCGTEYSVDDSECPNCQTCPECNKQYPPGDDECPHCGYDPNAPEDEDEDEDEDGKEEKPKIDLQAEPDMECLKCHSKWNKAVQDKISNGTEDASITCPTCKSTEVKKIEKSEKPEMPPPV